jgi:hypothetical protein
MHYHRPASADGMTPAIDIDFSCPQPTPGAVSGVIFVDAFNLKDT